MKLPILKGIYTTLTPQYRTSYPKNLLPISIENGVANGYLKTMRGAVDFADVSGMDRGGIVWNGIHYRAIGNQLSSISSAGVETAIGSIGLDSNRRATFDYSADRLAIRSGTNLYYYNGDSLTQVTDPDLGDVVDVIWIDGYFMTTDGQYLVVTELNNPASVDPIKYGSSEVDPDPILGLVRLTGEVYACNRHTIELFNNVGGSGFPFALIPGGQINKGIVGTQAKCLAIDTFFFVGGGRGEEIGVYIASPGNATKVSTDEIDMELNALTDAQQADIIMEARRFDGLDIIYIHLPDKTLCYNATTTLEVKTQVWFYLSSGTGGFGQYRFRNWTLAYNKWICGDTSFAHLREEDDSPSHVNSLTEWEFGTVFAYNGSKGAIVHEVELIGLPGSAPVGESPTIFHSWSNDGKQWSNERAVSAGARGEYAKRMVWRRGGAFRNMRAFKFRSVTTTPMAFTEVEIEAEALNA